MPIVNVYFTFVFHPGRLPLTKICNFFICSDTLIPECVTMTWCYNTLPFPFVVQDFSDWRPSGSQDQTKRRKKGNPEWEREQSLTQESPPPSERQHGTPRTFPRTKITPTTPTSQRLALENLRQHMTFSDQEDVSHTYNWK